MEQLNITLLTASCSHKAYVSTHLYLNWSYGTAVVGYIDYKNITGIAISYHSRSLEHIIEIAKNQDVILVLYLKFFIAEKGLVSCIIYKVLKVTA